MPFQAKWSCASTLVVRSRTFDRNGRLLRKHGAHVTLGGLPRSAVTPDGISAYHGLNVVFRLPPLPTGRAYSLELDDLGELDLSVHDLGRK